MMRTRNATRATLLATVVAGAVLLPAAYGDDGEQFVREVRVPELVWVGAETAAETTEQFVRNVRVPELVWVGAETAAETSEPFVRNVRVPELVWTGAPR